MSLSISLPKKSFAVLAGCALLIAPPLNAADITQNANMSSAGPTWNTISFWGDGVTPLNPANNYITASFGAPVAAFTTNGTTWSQGGTVRDTPAGSTFGGGTLTLSANTRLLGKSTAAANTNTANIIFNGGFIFSGSNGGNTGGILGGTLSFASGINLGAIALNSPNTGTMFTFTINSTIIGDSSDTLQLTMVDEAAPKGLGTILVNGDLSAFSGTLYVGNATSGSAAGSLYSIHSSAASATLNIDTATFGNAGGSAMYDLAGVNTSFGSLIVGGTLLGADTYDAAELNIIAGGSFFTGTGSITVVPEPSTYAVGVVGMLALAAVARRKRSI